MIAYGYGTTDYISPHLSATAHYASSYVASDDALTVAVQRLVADVLRSERDVYVMGVPVPAAPGPEEWKELTPYEARVQFSAWMWLYLIVLMEVRRRRVAARVCTPFIPPFQPNRRCPNFGWWSGFV